MSNDKYVVVLFPEHRLLAVYDTLEAAAKYVAEAITEDLEGVRPGGYGTSDCYRVEKVPG